MGNQRGPPRNNWKPLGEKKLETSENQLKPMKYKWFPVETSIRQRVSATRGGEARSSSSSTSANLESSASAAASRRVFQRKKG